MQLFGWLQNVRPNKMTIYLIQCLPPFIGTVFPAVFLVVCSYYGNTVLTSMIFLCIAFAGGGSIGAGYISASVDIAPKYAGIVMGIANITGAITGIAAPFVVKSIASAVSVCACVRVCVCACVRACVCVHVLACIKCACECIHSVGKQACTVCGPMQLLAFLHLMSIADSTRYRTSSRTMEAGFYHNSRSVCLWCYRVLGHWKCEAAVVGANGC